MNEQQLRQMKEMFEHGYGYGLISRSMHCAKSTVERHLTCKSVIAKRVFGERVCDGRRPSEKLARYAKT